MFGVEEEWYDEIRRLKLVLLSMSKLVDGTKGTNSITIKIRKLVYEGLDGSNFCPDLKEEKESKNLFGIGKVYKTKGGWKARIVHHSAVPFRDNMICIHDHPFYDPENKYGEKQHSINTGNCLGHHESVFDLTKEECLDVVS